MFKMFNQMKNENIVVPRIVNKQQMDFNDFCEYLADGTTVTAGDVAAVMKTIEMRLPLVLGMNSQVVVSPEGLTFRPKVSGSLTQSALRVKLQQRQLDNPDEDIDVNRDIETSDLSIKDIDVTLAVELPKKWINRFGAYAKLKRVNQDEADDTTSGSDDSGSGGTDNP